MGKKLTKELIETEGVDLVGKKLVDYSSLGLKKVKIIGVDVIKDSIMVKSNQGKYKISYPYTTCFSL